MDDQSYSSQSSGQSSNGKGSSLIKNLITVVFLVITPPIGIIFMWFVASWSHKIKLIITIIWILLALTAIVLVSLPSPGVQRVANEARVRSDMSQIGIMLEILTREENRSSKINCESDENIVYICGSIKDGTGSEPIIQISSDRFPDYCAYVQISSGEYYCVDSQGRQGKTATFPGSTGYCTETSFACPEVRF